MSFKENEIRDMDDARMMSYIENTGTARKALMNAFGWLRTTDARGYWGDIHDNLTRKIEQLEAEKLKREAEYAAEFDAAEDVENTEGMMAVATNPTRYNVAFIDYDGDWQAIEIDGKWSWPSLEEARRAVSALFTDNVPLEMIHNNCKITEEKVVSQIRLELEATAI